MKRKYKDSYDEIRKKQLLEDNKKEDIIIKRLSKKLKLNKSKNSKSKYPLWLRQCGFDYLLDFESEINNFEHAEDNDVQNDPTLGVQPKKKRKSRNIYGQNSKIEEDISKTTVSDEQFIDESAHKDDKLVTISADESMKEITTSNDTLQRTIRSILNRLSESHMLRMISELTNLFSQYPKAIVRSTLIAEVFNLLQCTPVNMHSNVGWLQQDLAVFLACVHIGLHLKFQHYHIIGYMVEHLLDQILQTNTNSLSGSCLISVCIFIAYLFRFGVISPLLILDLLLLLLETDDLSRIRAAHFICVAVGPNLRKGHLSTCNKIIQHASERLSSSNQSDFELKYELEGVVQRLSEKRSNEECVSRSTHLRKLMKVWTKADSFPDDVSLSARLKDFVDGSSVGRRWLIGSAYNNPSKMGSDVSTANLVTTPHIGPETSGHNTDLDLAPEVKSAANKLGLRTVIRQQIFNILVTTSGGPDATAFALIRFCSNSTNNQATGNTSGTHTAREREAIQIVLHCVMAEEPFNRFYPRVLGGFLNHHRRYLMMIKCAFWDILNKTDLTTSAKSNAGRALGLLALVYDFPLTTLKNFNFGDDSEPNVSFLKHVIIELCSGDYKKIFSKLLQLSSYTRLSRNCRIFMRKHFSDNDNSNVKAIVMRLISDLRESESL